MPKKAEIVPTESQLDAPQGVIRLAGDLNSVVEAFKEYQDAINKLLTKDDYQRIGNTDYKKKSAWRKLSTAFGITTEVKTKDVAYDEQGKIHHAEFVVRATAPNGRYTEAWGGCSVLDRKFSHDQDIAATAQTRATNRAIADLIGAGEVSAEEMDKPYDQNRSVNTGTGEISIQRPHSKATEPQLRYIFKLIKEKGIALEEEEAKGWIYLEADVESVNALTRKQASDLIDHLESLGAREAE